jgi:hypothetical protein
MRLGHFIAFSSLSISSSILDLLASLLHLLKHHESVSDSWADQAHLSAMVKRAVSETSDYLSLKEEPSTPPPTTPKKAKKSPSTPSTNGSRGSIKESPGNGMPGSLAKTARGRYMEMIYEAGLKAINKKDVQDQVSKKDDITDPRLVCLLLNRMRW